MNHDDSPVDFKAPFLDPINHWYRGMGQAWGYESKDPGWTFRDAPLLSNEKEHVLLVLLIHGPYIYNLYIYINCNLQLNDVKWALNAY